MAGWVRAGGGGIPSSLKTDMDAVLNKKFGTSTTYPPTGWPDDVNLLGPLPEKTVSGAIASFSDGADDVPAKSAKFYFLPQQASGTPSPSNPLAITGWTGLTAYRGGINFWNEEWEIGGINDTTGQPNSDTNKIRSKSFFRIKGGLTYYVVSPQPIRVLFYTENESFISETSNIRNNTFSVPSNASKAKIRGTVDYGTTYNSDISINYPATDTSYHAYSTPTSYPVSWSEHGTLYGGYVDATRGKVVKTHGSVDLGTLDWTITQTLQEERAFYTDDLSSVIDAPSSNLSALDGYCENLPVNSQRNVMDTSASGICSNTSGRVYVFNYTYASMTKEQFTTAVTGALFIYPLATPVEYDITAFTPNTLYGTNNFFSDANGDTEVTYRADIQLALNALNNNRGLMMMSRPEEQEETEEPEPESDER